ncbi:helix-turn-helix domain-containing protein [Paraburkholderia sp. SIMBA_050]|uniref:helix-turn-helix domain-containing protein n=1 Tax=Paraburkholderia terricola TaxID=169427 RepID=UPI001ABBCCF3|nr:helix-turn-helix domain-containing protein [Paraburkholderia terricola]
MTTVSPFFTWRRAMTSSELPSTTKLVLFVIAEYTNAMDDTCWPSVETIAEKASLSERCVSNHLDVAERNGWLTRWKSRRPARRWAHAHYRLSIPEDVARRQRDAIDFDLADDAAMLANPEPRSGNPVELDERGSEVAQESGNQERYSGNPAELAERGSEAPGAEPLPAANPESYRNHVPTNKPVNRNTSKPSLSQPLAVNEGKGVQREKPDEGAMSLARWMLERIRARLHDFALPDLVEWAREVEAMQAVDGRDMQDIARLFAWADRDRFWAKVITSPARLRKNWEELRRRRNDALTAKAANAASQPASAADDRVCAHVGNGCRCTHAATTIIGAGSTRRGYCRQHIGLYED